MADFTELRVWHASIGLAELCYGFADTLPAEEKYGLQSQIRRAAASIPANIAEGVGRFSRKDCRRFLRMAYGSACEIQSHALLTKTLNLGGSQDADEIIAQAKTVRRMLSGLSKSLTAGDPTPNAQR
jgi:four helix bundle protein